MVVVSYEWYKTTYGGELDEDTFNRLASQAFLFADAMTEYRLSARWACLAESVRAAVMSAVCAYADQANIEESGGPVSSETNDGISRTYATGSASSAGARRRRSISTPALATTESFHEVPRFLWRKSRP